MFSLNSAWSLIKCIEINVLHPYTACLQSELNHDLWDGCCCNLNKSDNKCWQFILNVYKFWTCEKSTTQAVIFRPVSFTKLPYWDTFLRYWLLNVKNTGKWSLPNWSSWTSYLKCIKIDGEHIERCIAEKESLVGWRSVDVPSFSIQISAFSTTFSIPFAKPIGVLATP